MSFVTEATKNETKQKIRYRRSFDSLADDIVHSEWTWLSQMKFWVVYYSTLRHPPSMGWAGFAAIYRMKSAEKKPSLKLSWSRERWKLISMTDECARPFNSYLVSSFMRKIRRVGDVASSLILSFKCRLSVVARDGMFSRKMYIKLSRRVVERVLECESTEMEKGKKSFSHGNSINFSIILFIWQMAKWELSMQLDRRCFRCVYKYIYNFVYSTQIKRRANQQRTRFVFDLHFSLRLFCCTKGA